MRYYSCIICSHNDKEIKTFDIGDGCLSKSVRIDVPYQFPDPETIIDRCNKLIYDLRRRTINDNNFIWHAILNEKFVTVACIQITSQDKIENIIIKPSYPIFFILFHLYSILSEYICYHYGYEKQYITTFASEDLIEYSIILGFTPLKMDSDIAVFDVTNITHNTSQVYQKFNNYNLAKL